MSDKIYCFFMWVLVIISCFIGTWLLISFLDVITHNIDTFHAYGIYLDWNFFTTMWDIIRGQT